MIRQPWWDLYPERLTLEYEALKDAGIAFERDEDAFAQGILRLRLQVDVGGERVFLIVTYPDLYPYFRFFVQAPDLTLAHHQNPLLKNLCLIGRPTYDWHTTYTLAGLLQSQLATVLETGRSDDAEGARGREQHQAEPYSEYYSTVPGSMILLPPTEIDRQHRFGSFTVSCDGPQGMPLEYLVCGAIREIRSSSGFVLARGSPMTLSAFHGVELQGCWVRIDAPIPEEQPGEYLKKLLSGCREARSAPPNKVDGGWLRVLGVLFPEETAWRQTDADNWLFVCYFSSKKDPSAKQVTRDQRRKERKERNKRKKERLRKGRR